MIVLYLTEIRMVCMHFRIMMRMELDTTASLLISQHKYSNCDIFSEEEIKVLIVLVYFDISC